MPVGILIAFFARLESFGFRASTNLDFPGMIPIQLQADDSGFGVLLSRIANEGDAQSVHAFFLEKGIGCTIVPFGVPGDYRVFVSGITMDVFRDLIEGSHISLL